MRAVIVDLLAGKPEIQLRMRRLLAIFVVWAGLIGAGAPAFACATAAAAGDCCPSSAPSGCASGYEQLGVEAIICCATVAAPSLVVFAEPGRELQVAQCDHGPADPVPAAAPLASVTDLRNPQRFALTDSAQAPTDASLTYLQTGRLRL